MLAKWGKRLAGMVILGVIAAAAVWAMQPQPVPVDTAIIDRGPLEVTVDEEGMARIRDIYRVHAPVAGRLERLPVHVGDIVHRDTTAVASIHPADPPFLDLRARREIEAAVEAARASVNSAEAQVKGAEAVAHMAEFDMDHARKLAANGTISARALEKAVNDLDAANAVIGQAKATLELRKSELISTEARLIEPDQQTFIPSRDRCCVAVRSPADGVVLKLSAESEQVVPVGAPLVEVGDPRDLEIMVHLLSSDAVNIAPGAAARLDEWGGPVLNAKVRRIDPAGFTKVSALGIEEQRVDAILDLTDPYETWQRLGHEFRVMVHITTWTSDDVIRVPLGALFRRGAEWSVFRVVDGRAVLTPVNIDHRNQRLAEVTAGLAAGDMVVLHPSDRVTDRVGVTAREDSS